VAEAGPADRDRAYRSARNLIHQSHLKEVAALAWLRRLTPRGGRAAEVAAKVSSQAEDGEGDDLGALERAYVGLAGKTPPNPDLSREERTMAGEIFIPATTGDFDEAMKKVGRVEGLHPAMLAEVFNFADGKRSALDIYDAVSGEALSGGAWYYGTVSPADVREALDRGVKAGVLTLKASK